MTLMVIFETSFKISISVHACTTLLESQQKDAHQKIIERHKFELLEDFQPPRPHVSDGIEMQGFSMAGSGSTGDWMQQKYSTEQHPVKLMVYNPSLKFIVTG